LQYCLQYMIEPLVRIVLDTNVVIAALRSNAGASRQLLLFALRKRFELLLSVPLMLEYEAVLKRPEHLRTAGATRANIDGILAALAAVGVPVTPSFSWRPELQTRWFWKLRLTASPTLSSPSTWRISGTPSLNSGFV
jgi:predicted nucleic acid-binding protein